MSSRGRRAHVVCRADELGPGQRMIAACGAVEVGVFNLDGDYFAILNRCPHKSAPLCKGVQRGFLSADGPRNLKVTESPEVIACPWHGWEFEIRTGRSYFNPHRVRARSYDAARVSGQEIAEEDPSVPTFPVQREDDYIVVYV